MQQRITNKESIIIITLYIYNDENKSLYIIMFVNDIIPNFRIIYCVLFTKLFFH